MALRFTLAGLWIVTVVGAYCAGWFKGLASAQRVAVASTSFIGYSGLIVMVIAVVLVGFYFLSKSFGGEPTTRI